MNQNFIKKDMNAKNVLEKKENIIKGNNIDIGLLIKYNIFNLLPNEFCKDKLNDPFLIEGNLKEIKRIRA